MPNTPKNITIPAGEFVDLYDLSGIPIGSKITVTQITDRPVRVTFGALPTGEYGYEPLMSVSSRVSGQSDDGAFAWSAYDCVVNVSYFFSEASDSPFTGAPSNILVSNDDVAATTVTADPDAFITAALTTPMAPPVAGYDSDFASASATSAIVQHVDTESHDYRIDFSGTIVADDPSFLDTYIGVKISSSSGQDFTGGVKFYPVGVSFGGASPAIGFSSVVFGAIGAGEKISLQLSSNTAGDLILTDLIMFAVRITPAGS